MRAYENKKNAQAKSYYNDRFFKAPPVPRTPIEDDEIFSEDIKSLKKAKIKTLDAYVEAGQLVINVKPENNKATLIQLKEQGYDFLSEMSAVDFLESRGEFEIFYQLLSMTKKKRMRLKITIKEGTAVESVVDLFKSANWAEREMYDMFGIILNNHPYLKRLIMPEDWHGHPLLKTYPLIGDEQAQWYEIDTIFGKEYRDVVGPENRDTKFIDAKDTKNFARVRHEVGYGEKPSAKPTDYSKFQDEGGVKFVTDFDKNEPHILKDRK